MTLDEIIETIKLLTVKVETDKEKGTGVLIIQNNKAYVLTVYHCIYGKENPYHTVNKENVTFMFNTKVCKEDIKPLNIERYKENLILLEVDINTLTINGIKELLLLDRVYHEKEYHLRGYPKALSYANPFEATCNDKDLDEVSFSIRVDGLTEDTSGDDAIDFIAGLSGSGVFFSENNQLYLLGLVNALATNEGIFNLIYCSKLVDLYNSDIEFSQFYAINDIAERLKSIENEISKEACKEFEKENITDYSNLNRKHTVVWHKNDVINKNFQAIKNYLQGKNSINEIKLLDSSFEEDILNFSQEVLNNIEKYISEYIEDKKEARQNLKTIREKTIESIVNDLNLIQKDTYISNKLQEYIVVGWLLNCNVDFILDKDD